MFVEVNIQGASIVSVGDRICGLSSPLQRRCHDAGECHTRQPLGHGRCLGLAVFVEEHAIGPTSKNTRGVGLGTPMTDENDGSHRSTLEVEAS